jgi:hypothetical protein
MATNYPTSLDNFTNPASTDLMNSVTVPHNEQHANANDAIEALQAKVGADSSAVTSSLDYKVSTLESDMSTAQSDISTLQSDVSTAESDISTLQSDVAGLVTGKILQVVQGTQTVSTLLYNTATLTDIQLKATITPSSVDSTILAIAQVVAWAQADGAYRQLMLMQMYRDGATALTNLVPAVGGAPEIYGMSALPKWTLNNSAILQVLDSPSTTSPVEYSVWGRCFAASSTAWGGFCGYHYAGLGGATSSTSTITLMEIAS